MADKLLDRESGVSEEEKEHRKMMSARMQALLAGEAIPETSAKPAAETPIGAYEYPAFRSEHVPAYQTAAYSTSEYHPPVVPTSPDAPSAARRLADYIPVTVGMQSLQRVGDMPAKSVKDYAPVSAPEAPAPAASEAPARGRGMLFENLLYQNGELRDMTATPEAPASYVEAPVYDPSYMPAEPAYKPAAAPAEPVYKPAYEPSYEPTGAGSYDSEEDATPTRKTMEHRNVAEERKTNRLMTELSFRTKMVLLAVAGVIILLLAAVCINTAIINSINEDVAARETEYARLTEQLNGINGEIADLTSEENIEAWALEHGMTR